MRRFKVLPGLVAVSALAACATAPPPGRPPPRPQPPPARPPAPQPPRPPALTPLSALPGWAGEDHLQALSAVRASCRLTTEAPMRAVCARLAAAALPDRTYARRFLEANFQAAPIPGQGVLTAYFAPRYEARERPEPPFTAPVRPPPPDPSILADAAVSLDRSAIEAWPAVDAQAWMRPEDLFFLQIQGSGVLVLPDGRRLKATFAAHNSHPFVPLARIMREEGLLAPDKTSGDAIRAWLADQRGPRADEMMRRNPRYVFFRLQPDDGQEPQGAAGLPLPAGRALAMDRSYHSFGSLYWIDADAPVLGGAFPAYRRLAAALDVGGAIKGPVRADLYIGSGDSAGREAGRVRHDLRLYRLVPLSEPRAP